MASLALSAQTASLATYVPRGPSTLTCIFNAHFSDFAAQYDSLFAKEFGLYRLPRITQVAERFLRCGDYLQGMARIKCTNPECGHDFFVPFSCKGFYPQGGPLHRLCPSCSQKRTLLFANYLADHLLLALPHRQFVFSIPRATAALARREPPRLSGSPSATIRSCSPPSPPSSSP